jgi:hypothetical protein
MKLLHGIVLILLCMIILFNIKIPLQIRKLGTIPVTITLLFIVVYLFTKSPILGIVGLIACYEMMQSNSLRYLPSYGDFTPQNQFQETLEEYMVKKIVPLVQSPTPVHLNFKYNLDDTHNASSL